MRGRSQFHPLCNAMYSPASLPRLPIWFLTLFPHFFRTPREIEATLHLNTEHKA